jgi:hypothetical protein
MEPPSSVKISRSCIGEAMLNMRRVECVSCAPASSIKCTDIALVRTMHPLVLMVTIQCGTTGC